MFTFLQSVFIGIAAVAVLGIGFIGAFAAANELNNLRNDIQSNDGEISTLQTRTNRACNVLNNIGGLTEVPITFASGLDSGTNAARINEILGAANRANCT